MILLSIPTSGQHRRRRREAEAAVNDGLVHFRHFQTKNPLFHLRPNLWYRAKTKGCIKCHIVCFPEFSGGFLDSLLKKLQIHDIIYVGEKLLCARETSVRWRAAEVGTFDDVSESPFHIPMGSGEPNNQDNAYTLFGDACAFIILIIPVLSSPKTSNWVDFLKKSRFQ